MNAEKGVELSVVIPISDRYDDLWELYLQYAEALATTKYTYEFIFVLDGIDHEAFETLKTLKSEFPEIKVTTLNRWVGEATALAVGFDIAQGSIILTLAPYLQVEPGEIGCVLKELAESENDLVISWRHPRIDSVFNRIQSWAFHRLTRILTGMKYRDISCGLRAMKREVVEEVQLYGDLHRFFPLLAYQRGFRVAEVPVRQSQTDRKRRVYHPGVYLRRLLDLLTLYFLFKFTRSPLRFFGLVGSGLFGTGGVITGYLGVYRLLSFGPIANRPLLILGVLVMVLGVQLFSIGLLGEIIIFTHARQMKDYAVSKILK